MSAGTLEKDIEKASVDLFRSLGWAWANVMEEQFGPKSTLGRDDPSQVVLLRRLRPALQKLNPHATDAAIEQALDELCRDRSSMSLVQANKEIHRHLVEGFAPTLAASKDGEEHPRVRIVDWDHPENNDFFLAQQFTVQGPIYKRRADLIGFVNGLPLVFIELKGLDKPVKNAFDENFTSYKSDIPQIFWANALVILSNGFESRIGSITSGFEHFKTWKRVEKENEAPRVSLEVMIRGVCEKHRLLDIVENFTLYSDAQSATNKIIGQNHQYLGVNNALAAVEHYQLDRVQERRRLGVFWHTQGSGKSYSMVFLSQKILRKMPGNWTFVIVTDREDLDTQIYKTFVSCGVVPAAGTSKKTDVDVGVQARNADHLKKLLKEDRRYVFTLIQKFRPDEKGRPYDKISDRDDIIVIADEAHRSQYDTFALNLRNALPNAAFIGFTGTPLLAGEEKTREVFGDYVSIYNFRQAIDDQATVPLWYEARIPPLQLTNDQLSEQLNALVEEADLDDEQQKKVEREFAREYHLITREDRLNEIAKDIVEHFQTQPRGTKAMVVAIDKITAVRMHDKVKRAWQTALEKLEMQIRDTPYADTKKKDSLLATRAYMRETDMAVVVSSAQNEVETFAKKGLEITPHRKRLVNEDLDTKFKDGKHPLRLVFVCAMWMTGFDVPTCGVIYLDKPMRNHTLMQTIARANRVYEGKENGFIVDYIGVFRNLQKALEIYGSSSGGGIGAGDLPVQPKEVLVEQLRAAIAAAKAYGKPLGVDIDAIVGASLWERVAKLQDAANTLQHPEDRKKTFLRLAGEVESHYKALGLDTRKNEFSMEWAVLADVRRGLKQLEEPVDISKIMDAVERLLDDSIDAEGYKLRERTGGTYGGKVHLGGIDFGALAHWFDKAKHKASAAQALTAAARNEVERIAERNPTRRHLRDELDRLIADYNDGAKDVGKFFQAVLEFLRGVEGESRRPEAEGLSPEELALFDIMTVGMALKEPDREVVKRLARQLPKELAKKMVLDWRKSQRARAAVTATITDVLQELPDVYGDDAFERVREAIFAHVDEG